MFDQTHPAGRKVQNDSTLYAARPGSEGGLGVTMATFGWLLLCWNLVQSLVPVFIGGLADRYGYKENIFISTVSKCFGYVFAIIGLIATSLIYGYGKWIRQRMGLKLAVNQ